MTRTYTSDPDSTTDVVPISTRLPPSMQAAVETAAEEEGVSRSQWIRDAISVALDARAARKGRRRL